MTRYLLWSVVCVCCVVCVVSRSIYGGVFVSGKMIHSMVAHLDAVTSLAIDPNGLYLLSGSEYTVSAPLAFNKLSVAAHMTPCC